MTHAIKCDRCGVFCDAPKFERTQDATGKDTTPVEIRRNIRYGVMDFETASPFSPFGRGIKDLCPECLKDLADFMEAKKVAS